MSPLEAFEPQKCALGVSPASPSPTQLTGEYPGEFDWDVAGLSAGPKTFRWCCEAELMNGRWAMLGVLSCLTPELLNRCLYSVLFELVNPYLGVSSTRCA